METTECHNLKRKRNTENNDDRNHCDIGEKTRKIGLSPHGIQHSSLVDSISTSLKRSGQQTIEGPQEMEASIVMKHAHQEAIERERIALLSIAELKHQLKEEQSNRQALVTESIKKERDQLKEANRRIAYLMKFSTTEQSTTQAWKVNVFNQMKQRELLIRQLQNAIITGGAAPQQALLQEFLKQGKALSQQRDALEQNLRLALEQKNRAELRLQSVEQVSVQDNCNAKAVAMDRKESAPTPKQPLAQDNVMNDRYEIAVKQIERLEKETSELSATKTKLEGRVTRLSGRCKEGRKVLNALLEEKKDLKEQLEASRKKNISSQRKLEKVRSQNKDKQDSKKQSESESLKFEQGKESTNEDLDTQVNKLSSAILEASKKRTKYHEQEIETLKGDDRESQVVVKHLEQKNKSLEHELNELKSRMRRLAAQGELKRAKTRLEKEESERNALSAKVHEQFGEIERITAELRSTMRHRKELSDENGSLRAGKIEMEKRILKMEAHSEEVEQLQDEIEQMKMNHAIELASVEGAVEWPAMVEDLRERLASSNRTIEELTAKEPLEMRQGCPVPAWVAPALPYAPPPLLELPKWDKRTNGIQKWKLIKPADGEPQEKKHNKTTYYWCHHHAYWTAHKPGDCRLNPDYDGRPLDRR